MDRGPAVAGIADDLTGANADGILLAGQGFRAIALLDRDLEQVELASADVVIVNTDSRALEAAGAYARVRSAVRALRERGIRTFGKRIDSTLRGNCGAEIDAVLDALGESQCAVVVSAYPRSGRTTVGGVQLVGGTPLERTAVVDDPLCPVRESSVPELLRRQSRRAVAHIDLDQVLAGPAAVAARLSSLWREGSRIVSADCTSGVDIEVLARGVCESGLRVIPVSPGPFTAAYFGELLGRRPSVARPSAAKPSPGNVLVVAGSVSAATRAQLARLVAAIPARLVQVDAAALAAGGTTAEAEIERAVADLLSDEDEWAVLGYHTGAAAVHEATAERMRNVARGLGELARRTLSRGRFGGIYTTGGEVSYEVCRALGAWGIELIEEVMPLAALGRLAGGEFAGLPIVTKGGLVGDDVAALACVRHLRLRMWTEDER